MIKAIFFDVDGTLFSHKTKDVPMSARKALEELKQKGIRVVVATGRHLVELKESPVNDIEFDFYITLSGQLCLNDKKEYIFGNPIVNEDKERMIQLFNEKKIPVMLVEKERVYMNFVNDYVRKAQADYMTNFFDCDEYTGNDIFMANIYIDENDDEYIQSLFKNSIITRWHEFGIDIISNTGGKVLGIKKYLEMNHIALEDTMAFGDGGNDVDMLKYVNIGVAMGNAIEAVKQAANFTTSDIDEDGVYNALKELKVL